jgi:hypothetical protein
MDTKKKCVRCGRISRAEHCDKCRIILIEMRLKKRMRQVVRCRVIAMDDVTAKILEFKKNATVEKLSPGRFDIEAFDSTIFTNEKLLNYIDKKPLATILVPLTIEFEIDSLLESMCKGVKPKLGVPKVFASILSAITKEEAIFYAKKNGLSLNLGKNFPLTKRFIAIHKDTVYSLGKTAKYLRDTLQ